LIFAIKSFFCCHCILPGIFELLLYTTCANRLSPVFLTYPPTFAGNVFMSNEADTCRKYILPNLKFAQWEDDAILEQYVLTPGRIVPLGGNHTRKAGLRPDYVLFIRRNIPIAVVEAKSDHKHAGGGLAQAMRYAEMLMCNLPIPATEKVLLSMISSPAWSVT
jgi:hypothetical protein